MPDLPGHTQDEHCRHGDDYRKQTMRRSAGPHWDLAVVPAGSPQPNPISGLGDGSGETDPVSETIPRYSNDIVDVEARVESEPLVIGNAQTRLSDRLLHAFLPMVLSPRSPWTTASPRRKRIPSSKSQIFEILMVPRLLGMYSETRSRL